MSFCFSLSLFSREKNHPTSDPKVQSELGEVVPDPRDEDAREASAGGEGEKVFLLLSCEKKKNRKVSLFVCLFSFLSLDKKKQIKIKNQNDKLTAARPLPSSPRQGRSSSRSPRECRRGSGRDWDQRPGCEVFYYFFLVEVERSRSRKKRVRKMEEKKGSVFFGFASSSSTSLSSSFFLFFFFPSPEHKNRRTQTEA